LKDSFSLVKIVAQVQRLKAGEEKGSFAVENSFLKNSKKLSNL